MLSLGDGWRRISKKSPVRELGQFDGVCFVFRWDLLKPKLATNLECWDLLAQK